MAVKDLLYRTNRQKLEQYNYHTIITFIAFTKCYKR